MGAFGLAARAGKGEGAERIKSGVEWSPICVGPDAQSERSGTEYRNRSKSAKKRTGEAFRPREKLESGAA
jgi:hypothetical protein